METRVQLWGRECPGACGTVKEWGWTGHPQHLLHVVCLPCPPPTPILTVTLVPRSRCVLVNFRCLRAGTQVLVSLG